MSSWLQAFADLDAEEDGYVTSIPEHMRQECREEAPHSASQASSSDLLSYLQLYLPTGTPGPEGPAIDSEYENFSSFQYNFPAEYFASSINSNASNNNHSNSNSDSNSNNNSNRGSSSSSSSSRAPTTPYLPDPNIDLFADDWAIATHLKPNLNPEPNPPPKSNPPNLNPNPNSNPSPSPSRGDTAPSLPPPALTLSERYSPVFPASAHSSLFHPCYPDPNSHPNPSLDPDPIPDDQYPYPQPGGYTYENAPLPHPDESSHTPNPNPNHYPPLATRLSHTLSSLRPPPTFPLLLTSGPISAALTRTNLAVSRLTDAATATLSAALLRASHTLLPPLASALEVAAPHVSAAAETTLACTWEGLGRVRDRGCLAASALGAAMGGGFVYVKTGGGSRNAKPSPDSDQTTADLGTTPCPDSALTLPSSHPLPLPLPWDQWQSWQCSDRCFVCLSTFCASLWRHHCRYGLGQGVGVSVHARGRVRI